MTKSRAFVGAGAALLGWVGRPVWVWLFVPEAVDDAVVFMAGTLEVDSGRNEYDDVGREVRIGFVVRERPQCGFILDRGGIRSVSIGEIEITIDMGGALLCVHLREPIEVVRARGGRS